MNLPDILIGIAAVAAAVLAWHYRRRFVQLREQHRSHASAEESKRNAVLESVLEGLGDSCLLVDRDRRIIFANHETSDLFHAADKLEGKPLGSVITDERILAFVDRVATSGAKWDEEEFRVVLVQDGVPVEHCLVVAVAPVRLFGENSAVHLRVVIRDETDRHETEQIRKDFVANASHELRTPLSIINGYLENLLDGLIEDPVMARKSLQTMQKHGERIARIVEDMLTLSKFESAGEKGTAGLRANAFSCRECVEDVVERLAPMIEERQARMELSFPPPPQDTIQGDRFYWDQIFFNLIENALKENHAPGLVVSVQFTRGEGESLIRVRDNGVGIPRADLPFIFKRFYRVAKHHSQKIKGTGLGLSIVRRAVEAHDGVITVDSTMGVETVFTIRLPDAKSAEPEPR
jgi:signal transduction histidine kinase